MAASVFSSALFGQLFPTGEIGRLWTDTSDVRAMLVVEGALAKVQGAQGVIPEISAAFIHRASLEVQIDPAGLAEATGQNGVSVPGLVASFRAAMEAPEHAQYVHWGATSQDIIDTALMLRLRQTLGLQEDRLRALLNLMAAQAEAHADLAMPARTYGQYATPTSWGAVLAQWGQPLADLVSVLENLRSGSLWVSLSGAAGTASALGPDPDATRAQLAEALNLNDPGRSWHTDRGPVMRIMAWMADVVAALGALGQGLLDLTASDVGEVRLSGAGQSSTMPQKQNPVGPSALVALNIQAAGLRSALHAASVHRHQRDGAAWFAEWMVLPQMALCAASALEIANTVAEGLEPVADRMHAHLKGHDSIHAEALSFALAKQMPRPDAQAETKALVAEAAVQHISLQEVARRKHPDLPAALFDPQAQLGTAPSEARAFAKRVAAL
ncbi:MAG: lyase family protein [Tateyamaria sp.]